MSWIEKLFPDSTGAHQVTSSPTNDYNCIAYAVGDMTEWWTHLPGYKWPGKRTPLIDGLVDVFASLGYERCESPTPERGFEKVALYAKGGMWKHAARLNANGKWVSKLGPDEDIEHNSAECLCGDVYGQVHCFMRRRIP